MADLYLARVEIMERKSHPMQELNSENFELRIKMVSSGNTSEYSNAEICEAIAAQISKVDLKSK